VGGDPVWADLSTQAGVLRAAEQVRTLTDHLDVLVHNAGIGSPGGLENHSREQWDEVLAVNAAAPLFLTQALLAPLRAAEPKARIVIVSSDSGRFSVSKNGVAFPYRMSKAAVNMLTLNLASALGPDGVLVSAMHPGWMRTRMGGPEAPVDPRQAAHLALHLATLPDDSPNGRLWENDAPVDW
jgi:NAD(P)-dependent dehydrogenase (short-subunit alcohol dehydrogenase family)